jgi:hypothetical protein
MPSWESVVILPVSWMKSVSEGRAMGMLRNCRMK